MFAKSRTVSSDSGVVNHISTLYGRGEHLGELVCMFHIIKNPSAFVLRIKNIRQNSPLPRINFKIINAQKE